MPFNVIICQIFLSLLGSYSKSCLVGADLIIEKWNFENVIIQLMLSVYLILSVPKLLDLTDTIATTVQ